MKVESPATTPAQIAAKRAYPTILKAFGDGIEFTDLDSMRAFAVGRIAQHLEGASWDTIRLVIETCEGEKGENDRPATVAAAGVGMPAAIAAGRGRWFKRSLGYLRLGRVARAARVSPWLPARLWLWAKRQAVQVIFWFTVVYLPLVVILVERSRRNRIARASHKDGWSHG